MRKACGCLLLALLIQVVASCGNLNMEEPSKVVSDSSIKILTITTGEPSVAGSILPQALDRSSLAYYFEIENLIKHTKQLQIFSSAVNSASINFPLELLEGYYRIRVYALTADVAAAYPKEKYEKDGGFYAGTLGEKCVLSGAATVDLRQNETIKMALTPKNINIESQESGIVSLKFYTKGWTLNTLKFKAFCGIRNKAGELVGLSEEKDITTVGSAEPAGNAGPRYYASVPAGTHTFYVRYESRTNPSIAYIWTDTIVVLPNQTINKIVALVDIIEYAPAAPTALKASYYDVDPTGIYCYVNFSWTDNAVNERGFQIDLKAIYPWLDDTSIDRDMAKSWSDLSQYSDDPAAGSFTSGGYSTATANSTKTFDDNPAFCVDGSLLKNSSSATFKLSRGVRYLARISAVGYDHAGNSDYCYVSFSAGGTGKDGYTPFAADASYIKVGD
ncbi:MAG: hypothetical protein II610_05320 [Treponema sp.]|nr:hypothetical protein [Treponema sp.]